MCKPLVDAAGRHDRRAIMAEAHRQYRQMRSFGWTSAGAYHSPGAKARAMRAAVPTREAV